MSKVTVEIDPQLCIAAANCVGIAPHLFLINPDGFAELLDTSAVPQGHRYTCDASPADLALLHEAVDSCPTGAILLVGGDEL